MSAVISPDGVYRYRLERPLKPISIPALTGVVIMVNPSTADATVDDPTIRKVCGFGERAGWSKVIVGNLCAFRATNVKELWHGPDPIGHDNDLHLLTMLAEADQVLFAWGPTAKLPPELRDRWMHVYLLARAEGHIPLQIGEPCKDGHPRHPLMAAYDTPLLPWTPPSC